MEDDPAVRVLVRRILEPIGYRILEAPEGQQALAIASQAHDQIDLLLTDVVMPHMNGPELVERLHAVRPDTKVLYMTGYTEHAGVHLAALSEGVSLIQKPFAPRDLAIKIRGVLDTDRARK